MQLKALKLPLVILVLLSFIIELIDGQVQFPQTPCRSIFNYKVKNGSNEVYGYLKFTNDYIGDYQLEVRMSVAKRIHGNIAILRLPTEDQIQCGADLEYEVIFPPCDGKIPVLTFVKFNKRIYCTGPPQRDLHGRGTSNLLEYDGLVTDMHEGNTCELPNQEPKKNISQIPVIIEKVPISPPKERIQKKQDGCGIVQEMNGREHFPWLATIYYPHKAANYSVRYHCSATLISNSHVVTAGHCVESPFEKIEGLNITIRIGRNNIKEIVPSKLTTTTRKVKTIYIHPMFDSDKRTPGNNIAVLELDQPVEYSELIRPACLWNKTDDLNKVVEEQAIVIGWGPDAKPKKFTMPIISHKNCLLSNNQFANLLDYTSFCAGKRDGDIPCVGNSGGSLLLLRDGRYYLRGLTISALIAPGGGCDGYNYNIFTDVAKFSSWISSIIDK